MEKIAERKYDEYVLSFYFVEPDDFKDEALENVAMPILKNGDVVVGAILTLATQNILKVINEIIKKEDTPA